MQQLLQKHVSGAANLPVHLDPEFEPTIRTWSFEIAGHDETSQSLAEARARRTLRNQACEKGGASLLHWYVYDFDLIVQLFECFSYTVQFMGFWPPWHQV